VPDVAREEIVAAIAVLAVVAYAVLGGADFGGGVWDVLSRGPRKADERAAIARAMGPVWEANHVWLIFLIVVLFTAFPAAYAALSVGLFVPFHLVLVGIVLRGGAFVFRAHQAHEGARDAPAGHAPASGADGGEAGAADAFAIDSAPARAWGVVFGGASVITPLLLGMSLGAVSCAGLVWRAPLAAAIGVLAVATCAYLAAVYLTVATSGELREAFRVKALAASAVVAVLAGVALVLTRRDAPHLWAGLTSARAAKVVAAGVGVAIASRAALVRRRFHVARALAAGEVALLLVGWALAQQPYLVYPDLTLSRAAAPAATLDFVLATLPVFVVLILPSLAYLFSVFAPRRA